MRAGFKIALDERVQIPGLVVRPAAAVGGCEWLEKFATLNWLRSKGRVFGLVLAILLVVTRRF